MTILIDIKALPTDVERKSVLIAKHRKAKVDGVDVLYYEAGKPDGIAGKFRSNHARMKS